MTVICLCVACGLRYSNGIVECDTGLLPADHKAFIFSTLQEMVACFYTGYLKL